MSFLFDSSAIINIIKSGKTRGLAKGFTIELALFECLNTVWKWSHLLKQVSEADALELVELIALSFKAMRKLPVDEKDTFTTALATGLTVYDAAYLSTGKRYGLTLVSDDSKLVARGLSIRSSEALR
jgi:predicted nucleic acid-binding protein